MKRKSKTSLRIVVDNTKAQAYWTSTIKPCSDPTHAPFRYYRADVDGRICDCCNWETAYMGGMGKLENYPSQVVESLCQALAARGIVLEEEEVCH
jgi:hypothetical protein